MKRFTLIAFGILLQIINSEKQYLFVYEHCRHGARMPPFSPSSNYVDEYGTQWTGDGELTNVGQRMHYDIGVHNRIKFSSLLSQKFDRREMLIESTNSNRTITSVQSQLLGMFPPGTGEELTQDELKHSEPPINLDEEMKEVINSLGTDVLKEKSTPFPVHIFSKKRYIFLQESDVCPGMEEYKKILLKNAEKNLTRIYDKIKEKYGDALKKYFGYQNYSFIYDFDTIISITDNFIANYDNGRDLSKFKEETGINLEEFREVAVELKMVFLFEKKADTKVGVMAASPMMRDILSWMKQRIEYDKENKTTVANYTSPKMVIHSGHDTSLFVLNIFMKEALQNKSDLYYPEFASTVFFTLYKENGNYFVEYSHSNYFQDTYSYEDFVKLVQSTIWSEEKIKEFCKFTEEENIEKERKIFFWCTIGFATTTLIFLCSTVILLCKKKKKDDEKLGQILDN